MDDNYNGNNALSPLWDTKTTSTQQILIKDRQKLDMLCVRWVVNRSLCFTEPTCPEFLDLIKLLNPSYNPPSRKRLSGVLVKKYVNELKSQTNKVCNIYTHSLLYIHHVTSCKSCGYDFCKLSQI